ncbi:MAG TPA: LysR substrate-binding domain-containing protein, partial [Alicycliphilus sp.]|nr:LysR substrate-binding domain-containing protein [Alicycliphilus sp.]
RFVQKTDKESASLRDGTVDLETGVVGATTSPEVRVQALFRDHFIGVVRPGHPLTKGEVTPVRFAAGRHVAVSRQGFGKGHIDDALAPFGLERNIATVVGGFATALALARASGLIASVPERHTAGLRDGLVSFALPFPGPQVTVSMLWHPRMDGDLAHRWLRGLVRDSCAPDLSSSPRPSTQGRVP